jgi:SAM-dependent methyltransferase
MIEQDDLGLILQRYRDRYSQFGFSEQAVGWGPKGRQRMRYEVLLSYWRLNKPSVLLDLGAGFGSGCLPFFESGGENYIGIELFDSFVARGRAEFNAFGDKFHLIEGDLGALEFFPDADIVVASGLFNSKFSKMDNYQFIEQIIAKALKCSRLGVAFNFISDHTDFKEEYIFYANIGKVIEIAQLFSRNFLIKKDYFPFEFSLFINKDDSYSRDTSIFNRARIK